MSEVLQTNVFFVITSIAVVVLTILLCVVLYYTIRILGNIREMTERLKKGSEVLAEDAAALHQSFKGGISRIARLFGGSSKRKRTKPREPETDDPTTT